MTLPNPTPLKPGITPGIHNLSEHCKQHTTPPPSNQTPPLSVRTTAADSFGGHAQHGNEGPVALTKARYGG